MFRRLAVIVCLLGGLAPPLLAQDPPAVVSTEMTLVIVENSYAEEAMVWQVCADHPRLMFRVPPETVQLFEVPRVDWCATADLFIAYPKVKMAVKIPGLTIGRPEVDALGLAVCTDPMGVILYRVLPTRGWCDPLKRERRGD